MKKPSFLEVLATWVTNVAPPWGSGALDSERTPVTTSSVPAGQSKPVDNNSAIACTELALKPVSSVLKSGVTTAPVVEGSIPAANEMQNSPAAGLVTPVMFFDRVTVVPSTRP